VTLGGGTPQADCANLKIAKALFDLDANQFEVVFIAGKMSVNKAELKKCINPNHRLVGYCEDIALEMSLADFAIVAGGSSMWELMYLGVPFLAVALTEAQKSYVEMLAEHKLCLNLGPHTSLESSLVKSAVTQLLGDLTLQTEFRRRYADLVKPESLGKRLLHVLVS
jgi:spore coat polysaccharide biosynthesis predicted glycosyltransferase SpsG